MRSMLTGGMAGMLSTVMIVACATSRPHRPPALVADFPVSPALPEGDLRLEFPVAGALLQPLKDTFAVPRSGGRRHEALDILAPRGSPVRAVEDGTLVRLARSATGGISLYQLDPTGTYCFYYAHLAGYANGVAEGATVRRGTEIGFVGSTGNAAPGSPHLHFAVFRLGDDKDCHRGTAVNPYGLFR